MVFDKFHVAKHLGEAVDKVRRKEHKELREEGDDTAQASMARLLARRGDVRTDQDPCCDSMVKTDLETLWQHAQAAMCQHTPESYAVARLRLDTLSKFLGERPRTIAFGTNDVLNVLDYEDLEDAVEAARPVIHLDGDDLRRLGQQRWRNGHADGLGGRGRGARAGLEIERRSAPWAQW